MVSITSTIITIIHNSNIFTLRPLSEILTRHFNSLSLALSTVIWDEDVNLYYIK